MLDSLLEADSDSRQEPWKQCGRAGGPVCVREDVIFAMKPSCFITINDACEQLSY